MCCVDIVAVDEAVADKDVSDAVDERNIAARLDGKMNVGHHGRLGDARIDHDQRAILVALQTLAEDRMVVCDVGADQQNHVGGLHVGVGAGRSIAAKRSL